MGLLPPGVVDKDIEPAKPFTASSTSLRQKASSRRSPGNGKSDATLRFDQRNDLLRIVLLGREIIDRNIGAFARISNGGGAAHARVAAGNQRLSARPGVRNPYSFSRRDRAVDPFGQRGRAKVGSAF